MLRKLKYPIWIIVMGLFMAGLSGCSWLRLSTPEPSATVSRIAVLPFTVRGAGISTKTGYIAADKLTTHLYLKRKLAVVDRSQVNDILRKVDVKNVYYLSKEQLNLLSDTLQAGTVVLGMIDSEAISDNVLSPRQQISLTLRFLDGQTGEILKILHSSRKTRTVNLPLIDKMLQDAVGEI